MTDSSDAKAAIGKYVEQWNIKDRNRDPCGPHVAIVDYGDYIVGMSYAAFIGTCITSQSHDIAVVRSEILNWAKEMKYELEPTTDSEKVIDS